MLAARLVFLQSYSLRATRIFQLLQLPSQLRLVSTFKNTILEYFKENPSYSKLLQKNHKFSIPAVPDGDSSLHISRVNAEQLVLLSFGAITEKGQLSSYKILREIYNRFKGDTESFEKLSLLEVSILCNSFFIGNVVVSSKPILRRICQLAITELETLGVTVRLLPLLKVLRKADFRTDPLMDALAISLSREGAAQYNMAQLSHTLAVLADGRYFNPQLIDEISKNVELVFQKTKPVLPSTRKFIHPEEGARAKDLTRLLWALSCLKVQPSLLSSVAASVVEEVNQRVKTGQFAHVPHLISDLLLSQACWRIYPIDFINKVVDAEFVREMSSQNKSNRESRFALFAVCAQMELPRELLPPVLKKPLSLNVELPEDMEKQLKKRRLLGQVLTLLQAEARNLGWTNFSCSCPIPYLNICGVTFEAKGKKIALEVLDPLVCMRHTAIPDRLMSLKIRLMKQRGYHVVQIPPLGHKDENGQLQKKYLLEILKKIHEN